jgi:chemotaxis signal transduction protein
MNRGSDVVDRVMALKRDFDAGFSEAPREAVRTCDVLAIRIAGEPYAMRVEDIAGLARGRRVVSLPSRRPEVLGLASIGGNLVSVHSLAIFLGHGRDEAGAPWLVQCADGVALAFGHLERLWRVPLDHVIAGADSHAAHVSGAVELEGRARPIVDVRSIAAAINAVSSDEKRSSRDV